LWKCMEMLKNPVLQEFFRKLLEFNRSIYWLVHNRWHIGFRHLCMLFLVLIYTLLGGAMFFSIETRYEHKVFYYFQSAYVSLLKNESLYAISTYYKSLDPANLKWTYGSAVFFSMNLYTTTGYGSIAPESMLGQFCAIWYSILTIPVTLVVVRDLGQWLLVHLTKIYAHTLNSSVVFMKLRFIPLEFCLVQQSLFSGYLLVSSVFVYLLDDWYGDTSHTGVSLFVAFYFSYISLSTIGLGDIMPNNATLRSLLIDHLVIQFHPAISTLFFFGLPVMKVVNRVTYIFIENGIFGAFTLLDHKLDQLTTKIRPEKEEVQNSMATKNEATEMLNGLTIRSLATFARANADVYGGGFGRVNLRKGDLVQSKTSVNNNQASP
uniref:Ion channel n=1 Tax=Angiostrongylus cantonensis TaxID=6313 RepID=A0A158PAU5_ANGCA